MRGSLFLLLLLSLLPAAARAEAPALLTEIANRWVDERTLWAFTQFVRETDGNGNVLERLERFDPSNGYDKRWRLLQLNGRTPSATEVEEWSKKKNKKKKEPKNWLEFVDLEHARLEKEDAKTVSYIVPLKRAAGGLFPGDKISVQLIIDKQTKTIEQARASIDEPFNVALGLAQVVDLEFDLELPPDKNSTVGSSKNPGQAAGTATAVVNRFGKRVEYTWTEFKRADMKASPRS